jgi:hypothetical protein
LGRQPSDISFQFYGRIRLMVRLALDFNPALQTTAKF